MKGLWNIEVRLNGDSFKGSALLSRLVINIIFIPAILWFISRQPRRTKTQFDLVIYGTYILLLWYILTIIDLFLRETETSVKYGYVLLGFFIEGLKVASDTLMIIGTHRILTAHFFQCQNKIQRVKAVIWAYTGEFFILVIEIMGLYYLGSLLAHEVLWVGIADTSAVAAVAERKESLQSAFFALQWILALMLLSGSLTLDWIEGGDDLLLNESNATGATLLLWIRALTELIVSTHYRPVPDGNAAARDAMYGICTILFLWLISREARDMITESSEVDPLPGKMEEETRATILQSVRAFTREGNGPPALRGILERIKGNPRSALLPATARELGAMPERDAKALRAEHGRYVDSLIRKYGDMGLVQELEVSDSERSG